MKGIKLLALISVLFISIVLAGCSSGSSGGGTSYSSSGVVKPTPIPTTDPVQTSEKYVGMGIQCVPAALYTNDATTKVTLKGYDFGSTPGTVTVEDGKSIKNLDLISWNPTAIEVAVTPSQFSAGIYNLTINPVVGASMGTQGFTIMAENMPMLKDFSFSSLPTPGRALPSIQFTGLNLWKGQPAPGTLRIFAQIDGNSPIELTISSFNTGGTSNSVTTANNPSLIFKGSKIYFYASNNSEQSNTLSINTPGTGKVYALFIGINDYKNVNKLNCCVADSESMKQALSSGTFNSMWSNAEIVSVNNTDATKAGILSAIDSIIPKMTGKDTFFMYYSGHGTSADTSNPTPTTETYICPVDCYISKYNTMLSSAELKTRLAAMPANAQKMLIFDSCYSGGFIGKSGEAIPGRAAKCIVLEDIPKTVEGDGFKNIGNSVMNVFFSTASKYNELSYEVYALGHGMHTFFIMDGLGKDGNNLGAAAVYGESIVGFEELCKHVADNATGQTPQVFMVPGELNFPVKGNK